MYGIEPSWEEHTVGEFPLSREANTFFNFSCVRPYYVESVTSATEGTVACAGAAGSLAWNASISLPCICKLNLQLYITYNFVEYNG